MVVLNPSPEVLESAAARIRAGGVVVIPTETVYGLACSALDAAAVRRVFEIKGRPNEHPLIVHVEGIAQARQVASEWPPEAQLLAERFWPGPLTLVLPRRSIVPPETAGGLDTVAIRMPAHPVAADLIHRVGVPLAAPSANLFMGLSPTDAQSIDPAIMVDVEMVIDGGPCEVGLESTVVDLSDGAPRILRPGGIGRADIQSALGRPLGEIPPNSIRRSPGMHPRHYAPRARVILVESVAPDRPGLVLGEPANDLQIRLPAEARAYGAMLYSSLRRLDLQGVEEIWVELPPAGDEWEAVQDRLRRASA